MKDKSSTPLKRTRAIYDRFASRYDAAIGPLERLGLDRLRAKALAALPASGRVLEVGAGTGQNFSHYPRGVRGVASELSCEMLRVACGKMRPPGVHLVQCGAESLPFADASFDAAFATLVFCSVSAPDEAFKELRRVVRPDGLIILLEHVRPEGLLGPLFDALNLLTVPLFDDHFNRRTATEARRHGFQTVCIERKLFGIINLIVLKNSPKSRVSRSPKSKVQSQEDEEFSS